MNAQDRRLRLRHGALFRLHDSIAIIETYVEIGAISYRPEIYAVGAH